MKEGEIQKQAGTPAPEELALIGRYTRRPLAAEEVYTFSAVLCDNEVDREGERFSIPALEKLAELFVGKTGIFDHDPRGRNQTARVYRCQVERDPARATAAGEPYCRLRADAYMVRSAATRELILEIDGGIKKEVSVGCAMGKALCSVCGADRRENPCRHRPGERYDGVLCHTVLEDPTDAYEWSFVAVPAQPEAGVIKGRGAGPGQGELLTRVRKAFAQGKGVSLSPREAEELARWAGELEASAREGARYRHKLLEEALRLGALANPGLDRALLEKTLRPLGCGELEQWSGQYRRAAARRLPLLVQTAPEAGAQQPKSLEGINDSFKV